MSRERRIHLARHWPQGWFNACAAVAPFSWHDATTTLNAVTCKLCRRTRHFIAQLREHGGET